MKKKKHDRYPSFFRRIPCYADRDLLVLEVQLRGPRQREWVQLNRMQLAKVRNNRTLTFPINCDRTFLFGDAATIGQCKIILTYDICGVLCGIFWRERLRRPWAYEFDLSALIKTPIELHPGLRLIFTNTEAAEHFSKKFLEAGSDEFASKELRECFDDVVQVRGPLPEARFPQRDDESEGEE
jgi:hypothetical protein